MKKKRYCLTCGSVVKITKRIWSYDEWTGKPNTVDDIKCSNRKWWRFECHPVTSSDIFVPYK